MAQDSVAYAVARTRVKEKNLMNRETLELLLSSGETESYRILFGAGYGQGQEIYDYERLLDTERADLMAFVDEVTVEPVLGQILRSRYDFHNIKTFLKAALFDADYTKAQIRGAGRIDPDALRLAIMEKDLTKVDTDTAKLIQTLFDTVQTPQEIDVALDREYYRRAFAALDEGKIPEMRAVWETETDFINLITLLRVRRLSGGSEMFDRFYLPYGTISYRECLEILANGFDHAPAAYRTFFEGEEGQLKSGALDKCKDNMIYALLRDRRMDALSIYPLLAYVTARENEMKNIRLILSAKFYRLPADVVKERLRDCYA